MTELLSGPVLVLLDALPEATLIVAPDGRIRYLNRAATELLGHERSDLEGEPVSRIIVGLSGQRLDVVAWFARWAQEPHSPQLRYLTLTGRAHSGAQLRLSVRVAKLERPEQLYLVTMRDVTAEQREHQDIKHAFLVISRILAITDDAIVNVDKSQQITFFNRKAEELFGYRADEMLGQGLDRLLPQRYRAGHPRHVESFRDGKAPSRLMGERGEIVGLSRAGAEIPLEASITKVFIDGEPTFSVQLRDIRARKAAEYARLESEQRFRTVFDHAMEAIALLDPVGTVLELNDATRALLGGGDDCVGRKFWALPWWPRLTSANDLEARQLAMRETIERCAAGEQIRTRAELIDSSGAAHVIDFSLRGVRTGNEVVAIVAEGRDITALVPAP
ncbi:MAG: bifunctional diguanylate cyclase/phosphodiesterase [Proteobacteria bacterium]|nr:bifunctional diguanylate cyclase/phosphodiesterase [Pseudomonadota bacterium]